MIFHQTGELEGNPTWDLGASADPAVYLSMLVTTLVLYSPASSMSSNVVRHRHDTI